MIPILKSSEYKWYFKILAMTVRRYTISDSMGQIHRYCSLPWLATYIHNKGNAKFQLEVCENQDVILFPFQFTGFLNSVQETTGGPQTSRFKPAFQPPQNWTAYPGYRNSALRLFSIKDIKCKKKFSEEQQLSIRAWFWLTWKEWEREDLYHQPGVLPPAHGLYGHCSLQEARAKWGVLPFMTGIGRAPNRKQS